MKRNRLSQMEEWERELDHIDWKAVLEEIDQALMDNLAAELGFPSFEKLEQASERVVGDFYVAHLSDGRWVWWNPKLYAKEDPKYFSDRQEISLFIAQYLKLDEEKFARLQEGLKQVVQTRRCKWCEYEFNPMDPARAEWDAGYEQAAFCSPECAMESLFGEMKEDFSG
jgi:hypothetical protein